MSVRNESAEFILNNSGLSTVGVKASIYAHYVNATDSQKNAGMEWYSDAQNEARNMSAVSGIPVLNCAAIIAHTSPKAKWAKNRECAWSLAFDEGMVPGIMWGNQRRAIAAIISDDPISTFGGPKTKSFCLNIAGDNDAVTIDVWMCKALGFEQKLLGRKGLYEAIADIFRIVANELGITPAQLQAIVWCVISNREVTHR